MSCVFFLDHIAYEINHIVVCVQLYADELCLGDTPRFVSYIVINGALLINSLNFVLFRHFIKLMYVAFPSGIDSYKCIFMTHVLYPKAHITDQYNIILKTTKSVDEYRI